MLFTGRIIWPNSLSPVNSTDFPLEQQAVPNVLELKELPKMGELPRDWLHCQWAVRVCCAMRFSPAVHTSCILIVFLLRSHRILLKFPKCLSECNGVVRFCQFSMHVLKIPNECCVLARSLSFLSIFQPILV